MVRTYRKSAVCSLLRVKNILKSRFTPSVTCAPQNTVGLSNDIMKTFCLVFVEGSVGWLDKELNIGGGYGFNTLPFRQEHGVSLRFGASDPFGGTHTGEDFGMPEGIDILASAPDFSQTYVDKNGALVIMINHNAFYTFYGHLSSFNVKDGQFVERGQLIGKSGNTGLSNGPHLHFEVDYGYNPVNPEDYWIIKNKPQVPSQTN
jgi:murein DD-endopeptidase MepM/ murein hydrolase activator NlpD